MKRFLYQFGYETPAQWNANDARGWDDESSSAFWVIAQNAEEALACGGEAAEAMVRELFRRSRRGGEVPSWKAAGYAEWIEENPEGTFSADLLSELPVIQCGEPLEAIDWLLR